MTLLKKRFYFVRHGQTDWNQRKICQGHTDIELNETGRAETRRLAAEVMMASHPFTSIFASPLKRAHETAKILRSSFPHLPLVLLNELKERSYGDFEGTSSAEMYRIEENEERDPNFYVGSRVEPRSSFKERIIQGINHSLNQVENPLIVSHGRVFLSLCEITGHPLIRQIPNSTLFIFEPTETGWLILTP